jgi:ribonuclease P protein component
VPLETLKKRAEYLRVRGGSRWSVASATVEGKPRHDAADAEAPPRFGFTVTKKMGGAVVRNRIRRRLKAAIAAISATHARTGFDYVLIARPAALTQSFASLKKDLEDAFQRVHHPRREKSSSASRRDR